MAYTSRHTGEEIDDVVDIIQQGGGGSSIVVDTSLSTTSSNPIANKTVTTALNGKQDKIFVATKPNGNFVLLGKEFMPATPSGDPMHYAYKAAGAVWNDSTGYWELSGIYDLTNEDMRYILNLGFMRDGILSFLASPEQKARVNLPRTGLANTLPMDLYCYAQYNTYIECINFTQYAQTIYYESIISTLDSKYAFNGCSNLKTIYGRLQPANCTMMFGGCEALERVKIEGLSESISFADSPNLSYESLRYMIDNCANDATFTITVHPDVYYKIYETEEWFDLENLISGTIRDEKNTYINIAEA